jgi:hypothetical protein
MKATLTTVAAGSLAPRPAAPAAGPRLASVIGNRAMRAAVAGTTELAQPSLPPAASVQLKFSTGRAPGGSASLARAHGGGLGAPEVHASAARGIATPWSALPHGGLIQRSFGRYDISEIQAHAGGAAAASATEIRPDAYATGNQVVLGKATDLSAVAHEATHVIRPEQPIGSGLVQQKGGAGGDEAAVHAAAARGVATTSSALPYADVIQRAFGRHDISVVQAHVGPEAAASAREMGAAAYTTGNHVVLGGSTDLYTVAHEAAHVVQQRGGVHLAGGVGHVGDGYERHADTVANAVVQGRSAEGLLSPYAATANERTASGEQAQSLGAPSPAPDRGPGLGPEHGDRASDSPNGPVQMIGSEEDNVTAKQNILTNRDIHETVKQLLRAGEISVTRLAGRYGETAVLEGGTPANGHLYYRGMPGEEFKFVATSGNLAESGSYLGISTVKEYSETYLGKDDTYLVEFSFFSDVWAEIIRRGGRNEKAESGCMSLGLGAAGSKKVYSKKEANAIRDEGHLPDETPVSIFNSGLHTWRLVKCFVPSGLRIAS